MFLKIIRTLYNQIKEFINITTTVYIQYASINLNPHKKVRGLAEKFASSVILCSPN